MQGVTLIAWIIKAIERKLTQGTASGRNGEKKSLRRIYTNTNLSGKRGKDAIRRTNKYHSKKTTVDGIKFDSKKEAKRYQDLKMLEDLGIISSLRLQVPFELIPSQYEIITDAKGRKKKKCVERSVKYMADFVYIDSEGNQIVEDTKGQRTKDYVIKRKLMLHIHGIKIHEI